MAIFFKTIQVNNIAVKLSQLTASWVSEKTGRKAKSTDWNAAKVKQIKAILNNIYFQLTAGCFS